MTRTIERGAGFIRSTAATALLMLSCIGLPTIYNVQSDGLYASLLLVLFCVGIHFILQGGVIAPVTRMTSSWIVASIVYFIAGAGLCIAGGYARNWLMHLHDPLNTICFGYATEIFSIVQCIAYLLFARAVLRLHKSGVWEAFPLLAAMIMTFAFWTASITIETQYDMWGVVPYLFHLFIVYAFYKLLNGTINIEYCAQFEYTDGELATLDYAALATVAVLTPLLIVFVKAVVY